MHELTSLLEVPVTKDSSKEGPIPSAWRPVFRSIVKSFAQGDFKLQASVTGVSPISDEMAERMRTYVTEYGETLTELNEETWISSFCIWTGRQWDTIVDLRTVREGRSDLVLQTFVTESPGGFTFNIHMIYVP